MSWWDTKPHNGIYGGRTIIQAAWPNVSEEMLAGSAALFEKFRDHLLSSVIPGMQSQMMSLTDK